MYASNLEQLLHHLVQNADAASFDYADFPARLDSLRRYGRLPRGRENHATLLTNEHIANAIFGLTSHKPGWAGHVAILLGNLRPVGGIDASFLNTTTLSGAVQLLLADKVARDMLLTLTLTTAECGTNANGYASITYQAGDTIRVAHFMPELAYSLQQHGAETKFRPEKHLTLASNLLVLNQEFFDEVVREAEIIRTLKPKPASNGSEYDAEEAEKRRRKALGVRKDSHYLNVGVDNQVTWPRKEMLVTFDMYHLVLLPKTKEHVQSISIDLTANKLSMRGARTVINRFLSILTWCDDQFAVAQDGWSGNPIPAPVPRRNLAFTTAHYWAFDRKIPQCGDARRALALYREARNAEQNFLVSYAVLNYYKIIEIRFRERNGPKTWIGKVFPSIVGQIGAEALRRFDEERGSVKPGQHIYDSYRLAVAHANSEPTSDPDSSDELVRLHTAADVLRPLARYFIKSELGVSDGPFDGA